MCVDAKGTPILHLSEVRYYKLLDTYMEITLIDNRVVHHWPQSGETCATRPFNPPQSESLLDE